MSLSSPPASHASATGIGANALITELKTRARLRLNAARGATADDPRLRDCLNLVSREVGFQNWDHARRVLGGLALAGDDMGAFWHAPRCNGLLSHWFASLDRAREALAAADHRVLVPYRRQFIVVDDHCLRQLGLSIDDPTWALAGRNLVAACGSPGWLALCQQRLQVTRGAGQGGGF